LGRVEGWHKVWNSNDCSRLSTQRYRPAPHSCPSFPTKRSAGNGIETASTLSRARRTGSRSSERVKLRRRRCMDQAASSLVPDSAAVCIEPHLPRVEPLGHAIAGELECRSDTLFLELDRLPLGVDKLDLPLSPPPPQSSSSRLVASTCRSPCENADEQRLLSSRIAGRIILGSPARSVRWRTHGGNYRGARTAATAAVRSVCGPFLWRRLRGNGGNILHAQVPPDSTASGGPPVPSA
jgi:hypothetical protein